MCNDDIRSRNPSLGRFSSVSNGLFGPELFAELWVGYLGGNRYNFLTPLIHLINPPGRCHLPGLQKDVRFAFFLLATRTEATGSDYPPPS